MCGEISILFRDHSNAAKSAFFVSSFYCPRVMFNYTLADDVLIAFLGPSFAFLAHKHNAVYILFIFPFLWPLSGGKAA